MADALLPGGSLVGHEVFISYSSDDVEAAEAVCERLEAEGLNCWIAPRNIMAGLKWSEAIIDALDQAKVMLLVLSASSIKSPQVEREVERAANRQLPIIPLRIHDVPLSKSLQYFISTPQWLNAFEPPFEQHLATLVEAVIENLAGAAKLPSNRHKPKMRAVAPVRDVPTQSETTSMLQAAPVREVPTASEIASTPAVPEIRPAPLAAPMKVCLLYKRGISSDERLLALLETNLRGLGHSVFIDRHLAIGVAWAQEIEKQIRESDAVIPLLSEASIHSEMLTYEVQVAYAATKQGPGKPRLLPVRVAYEGPLPHDLAGPLERLQYFLWQKPEDDSRLVEQVAAAVSAPSARPVEGETLEADSGAVPLESDFYILRPTDKQFLAAIARRDSIVLVKGARQMGKTSLLARGLQHARKSGTQAAFTDFQKLNNDQLTSAKSFYVALGEFLADKLDLDAHPSDKWDDRRGPNANFDRFIRQVILKSVDTHLVWGLDEVDRLFTCPFGGEVFALFRTWHNERALDPAGPWFKLTLAIAYATEAHLFITDVNQSPFNVGTRVTLQDFTLEQVADLNARYGSPLRDGSEVARLYKLIGGHPFLSRRGLYELATCGLSLDEFEVAAADEDGPFGDHLRRILVMLAKDPDLMEAMKIILQGKPCPDAARFYRLRSAGVIDGASAHEVEPRCELYVSYLRRHLL